jgi:hypothetical protein
MITTHFSAAPVLLLLATTALATEVPRLPNDLKVREDRTEQGRAVQTMDQARRLLEQLPGGIQRSWWDRNADDARLHPLENGSSAIRELRRAVPSLVRFLQHGVRN